MASDVIHQLMPSPDKVTLGLEMKTRCGIVACVETFGAFVVQMIDEKGGDFKGTHYAYSDSVTCRKCINLHRTGNIHGKPSRTSDAAYRSALPRRKRGATPLARAPHARSLRGA